MPWPKSNVEQKSSFFAGASATIDLFQFFGQMPIAEKGGEALKWSGRRDCFRRRMPRRGC